MLVRRGAQRVPPTLGVEVGMEIDDPGRHGEAVGVEHPSGRLLDASDGRNTPIANRQIRDKRRHAGAVINPSIL